MDDYYSLLGVDADASVDDIRGAYRDRKDGLDTGSDSGKADAARLNKAWNVLSDPYQRGRYDEQRARSVALGDLGADDGSADVSGSNGSGSTRSSAPVPRNARQARQQAAREARQARMNTPPSITPPAGTHYPKPKQRIIAMVIDLLVLVVLVSGSQIIAQSVAKSQKPDVVHQVDQLNKDITADNNAKSAADKLVSADKKANNTAQAAIDQKTSDAAKAKATADTKLRDDAASKLNIYFFGALIAAFFLSFLYLAVPSALTGRTLGKRFQHLKTLREDGQPLGVRGAVVRFGLLVLVTFTLYLILQQFAAVLVLFGVTMWMRNPNMQGLHDRFAHTIVVSDASE